MLDRKKEHGIIHRCPLRCKIKDGWDDAKRTGQVIAEFYCGQMWCSVRWDDELNYGYDEPSLFKCAGLNIAEEANDAREKEAD